MTPGEKLLAELSKTKPDFKKIRSLLDKDANLDVRDQDGNTPFLLACRYDQFKIAKFLLDRGASADDRNNFGATPLIYAVQNSDVELIKALLQKHAYRYWRDDNGKDAHDYAVETNRADISALLKGTVDLSDTFNNFAKKTSQDFPQLAGKLSIYYAARDTVHKETSVEQNTSHKRRMDALAGKHDQWAAYANRASGYISYVLADHDVRISTPVSVPLEHDLDYLLWHELGHIVVPGGAGRGLFGECVADVFTLVRGLQAGHDINKAVEYMSWKRARSVILNGDTSHFTTPVIQELLRLSKEKNLVRLSPVETANLTYRFVLKFVPFQGFIKRIADIFAPVRAAGNTLAQLQKCAEIMFQDHGHLSDEVFAVGKDCLEPFLHRREDILLGKLTREEIDTLVLDGPFWDEVRNKIKQRDVAAAETPQQKKERTADYLQVFGGFDDPQEGFIHSWAYEKWENQQVRAAKRAAYIAGLNK